MEPFKLLFWLKWTLTLRGYLRNVSALVGTLLALLILIPFAIGIGVGCAVGFQALPLPAKEYLLQGVLLSIYLIWLSAPLLGHALSDTYDVTKLFLFPISARQIFTGSILGSLLDWPVLLLFPTLLAVLIGFGTSGWAFGLVGLALFLFLFHTLALSQALLLLIGSMLRSRRVRDVVLVLLPLFSILLYVGSQMFSRRAISVDWGRFFEGPAWQILNLLPSGITAHIVAASAKEQLLVAAEWFLMLTALTVGTIYLAGWLLERVYAGELEGFVIRKRAPDRKPTPMPALSSPQVGEEPQAIFGFRPSPVLLAMVEKEFKYLFREPYFKAMLVNLLYWIAIGFFAWLPAAGGEKWHGVGEAMPWVVTGGMLFSEMQLAFNIFGNEGAAAHLLFLYPAPRQLILLGKNLALLGVLSAVNLVAVVILTAIVGAFEQLGPVFLWLELALVVSVAVGNYISIWFPFRVGMRGWRVQPKMTGFGCLTGLLYMLGWGLAVVLALPVLAALLVPSFWVERVWLLLTFPLATLYVLGLYLFSLRLAVPLLHQREIEIAEKLGQRE